MSEQAAPSYLEKLRGVKALSGLPYPSWQEILISGVGGLIIIALLQLVNTEWELVKTFIVPFGATAVLVFAAPAAPFSQPRNIVGGHLIAGLTGIVVYTIFKESTWWTLALANGFAIALMVATKTVHPPAGATALLPVLNQITGLEWLVEPVLVGCLFFVVVGVLLNNVWPKRRYPAFWL
ncbi:MAG: HPP family protein [Anaerolineae bacterium]|nr:HPP family protein [Anaerolineae bacterium]